jgi:hypothetical protein
MENRPLEDLIAAVRATETVWIRLAGRRSDDSWGLALLEITAGEEPPAFERATWLYEAAAFTAAPQRGSTVADWLAQRKINQGRLELAIADLPTHVTVERRDSGFAGAFSTLAWPSVVWAVGLANQYTHQFRGDLVADDAPAFLEFDQAAAAFFGLPPSLNRSLSGREIVLRVQDRRARIAAVRVRPTEIVAQVEGEALAGATLAVSGDQPGAVERLTGAGEVHLPHADGLPTRPWLALHRDYELLDRRYLEASAAQAGVEVEVDAATQLAVLLAGGEGPRTEFKRELPSDPRGVMKTVAAFANGDGGTIVFGIDGEGVVVGLAGVGLRKASDRLANLIRDHVHPLPLYDFVVLDEDDVLLAQVYPSPNTPYGVGTDPRDVVYYLRRGANSFPATPADVR